MELDMCVSGFCAGALSASSTSHLILAGDKAHPPMTVMQSTVSEKQDLEHPRRLWSRCKKQHEVLVIAPTFCRSELS